MSSDATRWAWLQQNRTPSEKLILLALADRAGDDHTCFPSVARLEQDTGLNRKTIIACLDNLQDAGVLADTGERKGATGRVKVYRLIGVESREQSQNRDDSKSGIVPDSDANSPKNGTLNSPKNGTQNLKGESNKNRTKGVSRSKPLSTLPEDFEVTEKMREWAKTQNFTHDIDTSTAKWKNSMLAKGKTNKDWVAAWRNGMLLAQDWLNERAAKQGGQVVPFNNGQPRPRKMLPKVGAA